MGAAIVIRATSRIVSFCMMREVSVANSVNRYDMNARVKKVLVRHAVDLSLLQWSCSRTTANFYGILIKEGDEFTFAAIDALLKDLNRLSPGLRLNFSLENWEIHAEGRSWHIGKKKRPIDVFDGVDRYHTVIIRRSDLFAQGKESPRSEEETEEETSGTVEEKEENNDS